MMRLFNIIFRRNLHNLPLRRIKEILNRFEHNVTVQSLIDQPKTNLFLPCQSQQIPDQNQPLMLELTFLAHCQCGEKLAQKQG